MIKKTIRLLQIEDNAGDVRLVREVLKEIKRFKCTFECAETLLAGKEKIKTGMFDVVLLDLGLAESFGIETLGNLLKSGLKLPAVIVMTVMDDEETGIQALKEGAQDYLIKGEFNSRQLSRSIQYAIERHESKIKLQALNDQLEEKVQERTAKLLQTMESLKAEIEERKRTEAALKQAKESAERASRAKSDFLGIINHELRTPLNGVLGFSRLLLQTTLNKDQQEYVETIISSAGCLLEIISEILDMVGIKTGEIELHEEKTNLIKFLKCVMDKIDAKNSKELNIYYHLSSDCPEYLLFDHGKMQKILLHLLSNAVKFTDKGEVILKVETLKVSEKSNRVVLRFSVTDTGIGIKEEERVMIFNTFQQMDMSNTRLYGGIGAGLSIVQGLLNKMGSSLHFESTPGKGSIFYFEMDMMF